MVENHMTRKPETRKAVSIETQILNPDGPISWKRKPIPWCTTHDCQALYGDKCPPGMNIEQYAPVGFYQAWCEVSQGGPDHKWWKTT